MNSNRSGQATALMVMTPIMPGKEAELRDYLENLGGSAGSSPLARLPRTHFGRWFILPGFVRDPRQPTYDDLGCQYLVFTSNLDGAVDSYLDELCTEIAEEAEEIWGRCVGCPKPASGKGLKAYLAHNQIETGFFFAAYPRATVADVRRSLKIRDRLVRFVIAAQHLPSASIREAFLREMGE